MRTLWGRSEAPSWSFRLLAVETSGFRWTACCAEHVKARASLIDFFFASSVARTYAWIRNALFVFAMLLWNIFDILERRVECGQFRNSLRINDHSPGQLSTEENWFTQFLPRPMSDLLVSEFRAAIIEFQEVRFQFDVVFCIPESFETVQWARLIPAMIKFI